MIPFNIPPHMDTELKYVAEVIKSNKISGDGQFTNKCNAWMESKLNATKAMLTTSGTAALDMAALLCDLKPGDEVILPSFTFPSTANAFVAVGAKLVFVDIRLDTMNIDENKIEQAITDKTKVVCVMHYAGVSCEMDRIMDIARKHNLFVVEDAAQAFMGSYKGRALGTIGDFGCFSFHETKNISMGEGGAILINDEKYIDRAEILREKGTNRSQYYRGKIDKYTWIDFGDSYLPSEINAAYLWAQLENAKEIFDNRMASWNRYYKEIECEKSFVPNGCEHNAHIFFIKCKDIEERTDFIAYMKDKGIDCAFHYVPLHSSPAGKKFGRFFGTDDFTTKESNRLVRLPLYYGMNESDIEYVVKCTNEFFGKR